MSSILSWDDLEDEPVLQEATNQTAALKAAEALQTLDASAGVAELQEQAQAAEKLKALRQNGLNNIANTPLNGPMTGDAMKAANQRLLDEAKKIVSKMDEHLESGGRVNVADKHLLNCQSDLNQLIPFKYNWSWSLYITSCEHHWMPNEAEMNYDIPEFNKLSTVGKKIIARTRYNNMSRERLFTDAALLTLYRVITNPECRQYILRQSMEVATIRHAWDYIDETLAPREHLVDGFKLVKHLSIEDVIFKDRHKTVMESIRAVHDPAIGTDTPAKVGILIEAMTALYAHVNGLFNIVGYYQILKLNRATGQMNGLSKIIVNMIRDMITQISFAKLFISTMIEENPEALTPEIRDSIKRNFKKFIDHELDFVSVVAVDDGDYKEIDFILTYLQNDWLSGFGLDIPNKPVTAVPEALWFLELIRDKTPAVDMEAGLKGSGGSLGW